MLLTRQQSNLLFIYVQWWQQWHNSSKIATLKIEEIKNNNQLGPSCGPSAYIHCTKHRIKLKGIGKKRKIAIKLTVCYGKSAIAKLQGSSRVWFAMKQFYCE